MKRACIFVDGENFRHSLKRLFPEGQFSFKARDYLPETDWHRFFESIANQFECELLRTYWYVVEQVDCRPYRIPYDWNEKARVLGRHYAPRIQGCTTDLERQSVLIELERALESDRRAIEQRAKGWREVQSSIESDNDQLEFRRCGSIPYDLFNRKFGTEKGVDTQLTTDLIEL